MDGRDWLVSVSDFDAWLSERDTARVTGKSRGDLRQSAANDVDALAEQALAASGFRRARGAR